MRKPDPDKTAGLLSGLQAGEEKAFRVLHREYCPLLIGYSFGVVASREAAEDVVSDAFCKLFLARKDMSTMGHARRFLYLVTRNMSVDQVRARSRERLVDCNVVDLVNISNGDETVNSYDDYGPDLMERVYREVERLPEKSRAVFKGYFYEGLTTAEIAIRLDINTQTVLNHKSGAVKTLRKRLGLGDFLFPS
ncbi:MAG: sigma-70 family RNA polymerase sigma factor [Puia sp.]|nr:sigma-70 family RNA polymerase sigma factor [Puia sp.]